MFAQFDRFFLEITEEQASTCSHPGPCDGDVYALSLVPAIRRQFDKVPPEDIAAELKVYGTWNDEDLKDHAENIQRILWIACGDIIEGRT
jgi:hypothetical protein